ncbi:MAG: DUF3859 domain-containing protein [Promethearchaeota archaeon]|nr:DUF3859 domain-containing protein [Deltaproteobacteria bacterium]
MKKLCLCIVLALGLLLGNSSVVFSGDVYTEITDYGIYTHGKDWKMVKTTTNIPMKLGTRFGVLFNLKGKPEGTKVRLRTVIIYPKQGMTNPKTGKTYHKSEFYFTYTTGGINGHLNGFFEPCEMVSGQWTFQVWDGDNKILEKTFKAYKP